MTISDLIAQLTRLQKEVGSSAQVMLCSAYNSLVNPFDSFEVRKPMDGKDVYLVPNDRWLRSDLKSLAQREAQQ